MTDAVHRYSVFGLRVASAIELPELSPSADLTDTDVHIDLGTLSRDATPGLTNDGDALLLTVPDVASYRIVGGRQIIVDAAPGAVDRNVRLFLLGSAFGALLHQRGLLPMHANAVEIDGHAVAFMGESGAGKSTLAAWFHDRDYRIIADDVCVLGFDSNGRAHAQPGLPRLRLWQEALEATGRNAIDYARSFIGDENFEKYDVRIAEVATVNDVLPLGSLYLLERGDRFTIRQLAGIEAAEAVFAHTYRGAFVSAVKAEQRHWDACIRLVRSTPIFAVSRIWGLDRLDDQSRSVLRHAETVVRQTGRRRGAA